MILVSSAEKTSVKSMTIGLAPAFSKIIVSMPGGERNFQFSRSSGPASEEPELSDSWP